MFDKLSSLIKTAVWKIIRKLLIIPRLNKWSGRIVQLYDTFQVERELDSLNGKHEVRLNFVHYLPDTEERIEGLRRVINKRPVAIILHGPSAVELEERITELADCDICYFGLNEFWVPEIRILQKINRNLSVIMYSALTTGEGSESEMGNIISFLERREDNIFISERDSFHPLELQGFDFGEFIKKYDKKTLFFTGTSVSSITISSSGDHWRNGGLFLQVPSIEYPLHFPALTSFSVLLSLALIGEAPMVVVFGGDGGRISGQRLHYRETGSYTLDSDAADQSIMVYTKSFNVTMPLILEKIYKIYNLKPVDIINCSLQSNYTPLRKLSYDDTFALLKSFKKDTS